MSAHSFLAGADEKCRHQPLIERDVVAFEERPDRNRELLAAGVALIPAETRADRRSFADDAAMTADRAIRPELRLSQGYDCRCSDPLSCFSSST